MGYHVGYFLPATENVYGVIRSALPNDMNLVIPAGRSPQDLIDCVRDLDFLVSVKASEEMIRNAPKLRLIQLPGVGYDQVNLAAAARAGIPVSISAVGTSDAVAEHTLLLILATCRRLVELSNSLQAGKWWMWERRTVSYGLSGKTLGIVGMGRIGREVAARAAAFGMSIQYCDVMDVDGFKRCSLEDLL